MTASPIRVAAIGITPPIFKASGGISAGIQLTRRIAQLCEANFVLMADQNREVVDDGLSIISRMARNRLRPFQQIVPQSAYTFMWRPALRSWLASTRPSIVHLHNPHPPGALAQVARDCRSLGIPYVISTHGFVEFSDYAKASGAAVPLAKFLIRDPVAGVARGADRVFMLSPEEAPILRSMGVPDERLVVVTNGSDPFFLEDIAEDERQRLVARFGLKPGVPVLFFVGNHTPNKGIDVFLRAAKIMQGCATAVVGGAIRSKSAHAELLQSLGIASNDPRFVFTDFTTREELRALYRSSAVFVFPSLADTLPLVILEAMLSGLPVASTRVGGIPYEVTPETGVLVAPGDHRALAAELDRLCANPELRARMGIAGRARAIKMFSWERSAEKAVDLYREILAQRGARDVG